MPAPQLLGKTVREVTEECMKLGLNPVLVGTGIATEQSPEPGSHDSPRQPDHRAICPRRLAVICGGPGESEVRAKAVIRGGE